MTIDEVEVLRRKGWQVSFTGAGDGWWCRAVALGLAHGEGSGETLCKAAEQALQATRAMEDDPKVLIKEYGPRIEKLAKEIFGEAAYQGIEPVESPEPGEPLRIAISVEPKVTPKEYVDQDMTFTRRLIDEFPRQVSIACILEVDWHDDSDLGR